MTSFESAMKTILEAMSWTNYGSCPPIHVGEIISRKAGTKTSIRIKGVDTDTEEYQDFTGSIIAEVQTGTIEGRSSKETDTDNIELDLRTELPDQGCSIKNIDRSIKKNKYRFEMTIERIE